MEFLTNRVFLSDDTYTDFETVEFTPTLSLEGKRLAFLLLAAEPIVTLLEGDAGEELVLVVQDLVEFLVFLGFFRIQI